MSGMPEDFHNSLARTVMDQFELATTIIDYGVNYLHVMETTRLLAQHSTHQPENWPVWYAANYVFDRSTATETQSVTSSYSTTKLMLFSSNSELFSVYMGGLVSDAIPRYFPTYQDGGSHESKRMVGYMVDWACTVNEKTCLDAASENFQSVKSGASSWTSLDINYWEFSLYYGIRNGDETDIQFIIDSIVKDQDSVKNYIKALSHMRPQYNEIANQIFDYYVEDNSLFEYALQEFGRQPLMRDTVINYLTEKPKESYTALGEGMSNVVGTVCAYIQTPNDLNMIVYLKEVLQQVVELDDATISAFARCDERYAQNSKWMNNEGELIVYWIRALQKTA